MSTASVPGMRAQMQKGGAGRDAGADGGTAGSGGKTTAGQQKKRQRGGAGTAGGPLQRRGTGEYGGTAGRTTCNGGRRRRTAENGGRPQRGWQSGAGGLRRGGHRQRRSLSNNAGMGGQRRKGASADRKTQRVSEDPLATAAGDSRRRRGDYWATAAEDGDAEGKGQGDGQSKAGSLWQRNNGQQRRTPHSGGETAGRQAEQARRPAAAGQRPAAEDTEQRMAGEKGEERQRGHRAAVGYLGETDRAGRGPAAVEQRRQQSRPRAAQDIRQ